MNTFFLQSLFSKNVLEHGRKLIFIHLSIHPYQWRNLSGCLRRTMNAVSPNSMDLDMVMRNPQQAVAALCPRLEKWKKHNNNIISFGC